MSLPKQLAYPITKSSAVASLSTSFALTPTSQSVNFAPGQTVSFDIPTGQRATYLNPAGTFLRFTVTPSITSANADLWYSHAFDFIKTLTLYGQQGSTQIETIDQYAALHAALRDLCSDRSNITASDSIMLNADVLGNRCPSGLSKTTSFTFCMPLVSVLGTLAADQAYLPVHALNAPLRLDLVLASAASAINTIGPSASASATSAVNYSIAKIELNLNYVTISDIAQSQIHQMCGGKYQINSTMWRNFRTSHPATQQSNSIQIPARYDSVRSILTIQRDSSVLEDWKYFSNTERIKNQLQTYQYRIGSSFANPKPVDCTTYSWPYVELRKIFNNVSSENMPGLLRLSEYSIEGKTATSTSVGSFMIGLEAQPFSQVQGLISGTSTLANQIWLDMVLGGTCVAATIDSYCEADCLLTFDSEVGQLSVAY